MEKILRLFKESSLYDACLQMLNHLQVSVNEVTREPIPFVDLYQGAYSVTLPIALKEVVNKLASTYYIGNIDEATLAGHGKGMSIDEVNVETQEGKYDGMMVFAVDVKEGMELTRQESTILTRGFNRIASAQPVILFIRQGKYLSLSTCERMKYSQEWRNGGSEKLGKVSILRNINCEHPHRGHLDILEALGNEACTSFEQLYKHWMKVFSNELLTKKFYSELSDWYAWAVQVARFPNDLCTNEDDERFNHEACIRLITRLIFVWFLKQKHLIPNEFFDEDYIREHFIENFDPHDRKSLLYDTEKSKYYRLILQNLFFAMLNRPIVAEGKDEANNRRFRAKVVKGGKNWDFNVNNLMRYEGDFMPGGAEEFLRLANSNVPFLNGGLFECLDDKINRIYYDGFSENEKSLSQLYLPDYLFFGDEVGAGIDLSKWYGDKKKKNVSAQGIIDILRHYCFTVEENTPYDQEVSLDPELLGKAFENLLAAYNPETQTSARKQTGSFYTPREIVQYMVNESLVAHLKRVCGEQDEVLYRQLLSYSTEDVSVTEEKSHNIMDALYHCRVLDPACGSGAFPMGILQQMVHVLKRIDPTNEKWKDFMIDRAISQSKQAFAVDSETERRERLADIESAFNQSVNDPDYARKLYLIEHCIYGVDIQPIATQISKLRFFISLVVDQRPTDDATHNFGIRPLPNLEAKFVSANTLIPVEYDSSLVDGAPDVIKYKELLKELNHKIFLARRNIDKQNLKKQIKETRKALADAIEETGFVSHGAAQQLADWDMFDQNTSSSFFDPEWMFGVKGGFDIVIANPPYVLLQNTQIDIEQKKFLTRKFHSAQYKIDLYHLFMEYSILYACKKCGIICLITPITFSMNEHNEKLREIIVSKSSIIKFVRFYVPLFENASVDNAILITSKQSTKRNIFDIIDVKDSYKELENIDSYRTEQNLISSPAYLFDFGSDINDKGLLARIEKQPLLNVFASTYFGIQTFDRSVYVSTEKKDNRFRPVVDGINVRRYQLMPYKEYVCFDKKAIKSGGNPSVYVQDRVLVRQIGAFPEGALCPAGVYTLNTIYNIYLKNKRLNLSYLLAVLNSKVVRYYWLEKFSDSKKTFPKIKKRPLESIPIVEAQIDVQNRISKIVTKIINGDNDWENYIDVMIFHLYGLTYDEVLTISPETLITPEQYVTNYNELKISEEVKEIADTLRVDRAIAAHVVNNGGEIPDQQSPEFETARDIPLKNGETLYEWIIRNGCTDIDKVEQCLISNGISYISVWKQNVLEC